MSTAGGLRGPFARYWASAFLADFGDGVRMAAFPLLAVHLTSSPIAVAAVTAVQGLPWLVFGPGVGALVDRLDLRRVMAVVDVARAVTIGALAGAVLAGIATMPLLYAAAFLTGVGAMARDTAASTAVPRLVDEKDLEAANGRLQSGTLVGGELAGPAAGGWLFGVAAALPFALNAGGLTLAVLLLLTLPNVFAPAPGTPDLSLSLRDVRGDIVAGLRWLWRDLPLRDLSAAVVLVTLADGAFLAILVLYVTQVLMQPPGVYGLLLGVGAVGGIVAGFGCAPLARRMGPASTLALTMVLMAAAQLAIGLTTEVAVAVAALAVSSAAFVTFNVVARTLRQRRSPPDMLGRTNSTYLTIGRTGEATGAILGGVLAATAGVRAPILAGVLPLLAAGVVISRPFSRGAHDTE
ncbi:MFS transporter [Pseudonocardia sp. KRD291]|uniref:MFS transporter n=1 Tax=Pseudonocardia sp. KRD291 TaxID=2792007 RepID=UPI001C4A5029|nr:MFS transporter [Pseudonocardia sp. KRD291]MBW0101632.1 MFS transporter [Pseudonocardia sp. KRD291]